jgi:uncharacterized caspase-like protein
MAVIQIPNGATPGTHALVIGVSDYPFLDGPDATEEGADFGLSSLTSAARSASEVANWLLTEYRNPAAPLASLRVLLSPAGNESIHPAVAAALPGPVPATRAAVEADLRSLRDACRQSGDNVCFVYIAGHGIQLTKRGAVVLLHDFADPGHLNKLHGAIDVVGCHDGMEESEIAQSQVWFADACRQRPDVALRFERMEGALTLDERLGRVRASPLYLASSTRESAFGEVGGTSIFSQALLWALRGGGAVGPDEHCPEWHVSTARLGTILFNRVKEVAAAAGESQLVDVMGPQLEVAVQRFAAPPDVDIVVNLRPEGAAPGPAARLLFNAAPPGVDLPPGWPVRFRGPAGLYLLKLLVEPERMRILRADPPRCTEEVEVA